MKDDLKKHLVLDKNALDDELIHQASLLYTVSEAYEGALAERDNLKEQLATVDAQIDSTIRADEEKQTEAAIKHLIAKHNWHRDAYLAFAEAKAKAGKLGALKDAFKERGYMLRELCSLYLSNYYTQDSVRSTQATDDASYQQRRIKMAEGRQRRTVNDD